MAKKNFLVHLDMNKQELQNTKAHNLSTAHISELAATLVAEDKGLFVYDTDLLKLFAWNGTAFADVTPAPPQVGQYRGGVLHTATEPANLVAGDWVTFTSAGVVTNFGGTQTVQIGDWAIYNGTTWDILQGNVDVATTTTVGLVQLATSAEAIAGTDANKAITPSTLEAGVNGRTAIMSLGSLPANTPTTFTHNLHSNVLAVQFNVNNEASNSELYWEVLDENSISVTSNVAVTSVNVFITSLFSN
jgi:hypothetical protein